MSLTKDMIYFFVGDKGSRLYNVPAAVGYCPIMSAETRLLLGMEDLENRYLWRAIRAEVYDGFEVGGNYVIE